MREHLPFRTARCGNRFHFGLVFWGLRVSPSCRFLTKQMNVLNFVMGVIFCETRFSLMTIFLRDLLADRHP